MERQASANRPSPHPPSLRQGKFPTREAAARAADLAAVKVHGPDAQVGAPHTRRQAGCCCSACFTTCPALPSSAQLCPALPAHPAAGPPTPAPSTAPSAPLHPAPPPQTNFPVSDRHAQLLKGHSAEAVVAALQRNSQLALARGSR